MRVIGGRFKGRKLISFQADHIRPTTDRVKESIFNILMGQLEGSRVLDLFSGTGSLTCEALSRGAVSVEAVEVNRKSLQIMRDNFAALGVSNEVRIHAADVLKFLKKYSGPAFNLIFIDPPFTEKMGHQVMETIAASPVIGASSTIIIEYSRHEVVESRYGSLFRYNERDFGDKKVAFFRIQEP